METAETQLRAEHDAVLERVASRLSIEHFAHGTVATGVGVVFLAAAVKLWWDFSESRPEYFVVALGITAVALTYGVARLWIGRAVFKRERAQIARLLELRRTLELDVPGSMLPR